MTNSGDRCQLSLQPKMDVHELQTLNEFMKFEVCLLIGLKGIEKSLEILKIACEMLFLKKVEHVVFLKKCKGFQGRSITLKYSGDRPYFPEYELLYKFLRENLGEECFLDLIHSEQLIMTTLDQYHNNSLKNSLIIFDEIEDLDMEQLKNDVMDKKVNNKILLTYSSENIVFTELVIQELDNCVRKSQNGSLGLAYMPFRDIQKKRQMYSEEMIERITAPFITSEVSEINIPVNIKGREVLLNFCLKGDTLTLRNPEVIPGYVGKKRFTTRRNSGDNVIHLIPPVKESPDTEKQTSANEEKVILPDLISYKEVSEPLVKESHLVNTAAVFWGVKNSAELFEAPSQVEASGSTGGEVEEEGVYTLETEKVQSPFWGTYKNQVLKQKEKPAESFEPLKVKPQEETSEKTLSSEPLMPIDNKKKYIVGKIAGSNLLSKDQSWIIRKGDLITAETVDKAAAEGLLVELIINMTLPGLGDSNDGH